LLRSTKNITVTEQTDKFINAFKALVRKSKEKRPFGKFRSRWQDNVKIEIKVVG
jgi:hypothetical protein